MNDFQDLWQLFRLHGSSNKREEECARLWNSYAPTLRQQLYDVIRVKLEQDKFVHYDPLRAMQENAQAIIHRTLSYNEYYKRYGTTEEKDGWKMANPTGRSVIYVRRG